MYPDKFAVVAEMIEEITVAQWPSLARFRVRRIPTVTAEITEGLKARANESLSVIGVRAKICRHSQGYAGCSGIGGRSELLPIAAGRLSTDEEIHLLKEGLSVLSWPQ
jgi:hypothetical protein